MCSRRTCSTTATLTERLWPDRTERCFALRWLADAGVELAMGSDAPVSPLDPWLAVAAAVHRGAEGQEPWHPEQALTPREALAASTDGRGSVAAGHPADLALLDSDPLAPGSSYDQANGAPRDHRRRHLGLRGARPLVDVSPRITALTR